MKKLLFIGYTIPKKMLKDVPGASVAGNKMQLNLIRGIDKKFNAFYVSVFPIAAYPKSSFMFIKKTTLKLFSEVNTIVPFFVNLPVIKNVSACLHTYWETRRLVKNEHIKIILTFNMFPYTAIPALLLKREFDCEVISVIADLPIDDNIKTKGIRQALRKLFDRCTKKFIALCDRIIVLNAEAAQLYAPNIPYCIIEGGIDIEDIRPLQTKEKSKKNIVYSGSLQEHNGIVNLIKAMEIIEYSSEWELDIYGTGELKPFVEKECSKHSNIVYKGVVSNEEILKVQNEAYLLINPRNPLDPIARVTFPSKTFEYLLSGTPVLSTHLNGYSNDYIRNMFIIEDNKAETIAEELLRIERLDSKFLATIGLKAREMVLNKKNWTDQADKMCRWILREDIVK